MYSVIEIRCYHVGIVVGVGLHVTSPWPSPSNSPSKFDIVSVMTVLLIHRMGLGPILMPSKCSSLAQC